MLIIQSLPNLQVLKLHADAFMGRRWETNEHEFPQLKFLRLKWLNVKLWKADNKVSKSSSYFSRVCSLFNSARRQTNA
ncbi:hypothetical protein R6Q57_015946 [Mikania cordata]